ncbi:uncharacterized protein FIBRA_03736 [Fibroporia radiculosa]|uniref:Helicase C-terminal domain-containing protein n=1 Tax=Fibroporia radiculosa TaxID=599839 RepID=J4G689_9APHY|nr:uncharacterized protein FIBRA_03736 [Fibroporia radiculosa]CCM01673.1 predicted protein [Fibroporia radiculosa]
MPSSKPPTEHKPQDIHAQQSVAVPTGWTDQIVPLNTVKEMLADSTGLKIDTVELAELKASRYLFQSGNSLYFWNDIIEQGVRVTSPQGRDAVFKAMASGWTGMKYEELPNHFFTLGVRLISLLIVTSSSKLMAVDKLLADILPKEERVLISSQWVDMLELLSDFLTLRHIRFTKLDRSTLRPRRTLDIRLFQKEKSPYDVFLISTKAGGLGINLTKATTVIMFDSDGNPQNDLQAIARAHRIGQTKVVKMYRLICRGSVEDQMLDRIRRKLFLSLKVMGSNNSSSDKNATVLKTGELLDIPRKGSSALSNDGSEMDLLRFIQASIQEILDASRECDVTRTAKLKHLEGLSEEEDEQLLEDAEEEEWRLLTGVAQVQSHFFEGKIIQQPKRSTNEKIAAE